MKKQSRLFRQNCGCLNNIWGKHSHYFKKVPSLHLKHLLKKYFKSALNLLIDKSSWERFSHEVNVIVAQFLMSARVLFINVSKHNGSQKKYFDISNMFSHTWKVICKWKVQNCYWFMQNFLFKCFATLCQKSVQCAQLITSFCHICNLAQRRFQCNNVACIAFSLLCTFGKNWFFFYKFWTTS